MWKILIWFYFMFLGPWKSCFFNLMPIFFFSSLCMNYDVIIPFNHSVKFSRQFVDQFHLLWWMHLLLSYFLNFIMLLILTVFYSCRTSYILIIIFSFEDFNINSSVSKSTFSLQCPRFAFLRWYGLLIFPKYQWLHSLLDAQTSNFLQTYLPGSHEELQNIYFLRLTSWWCL